MLTIMGTNISKGYTMSTEKTTMERLIEKMTPKDFPDVEVVMSAPMSMAVSPEVFAKIEEASSAPVSDEKFNNLVNFLKAPNEFGVVFVDDAVFTTIAPEVLRTIAADYKGTINDGVRDEHDDLVNLPSLGSKFQELLGYPIPDDVVLVDPRPGLEPLTAHQQIGRINRQAKPDSDEFAP
jgi:hypothetical protein